MWKSLEICRIYAECSCGHCLFGENLLWHRCSDSRGDFRQEMICRLLDLLDLEPAAPFNQIPVEVCLSSVVPRLQHLALSGHSSIPQEDVIFLDKKMLIFVSHHTGWCSVFENEAFASLFGRTCRQPCPVAWRFCTSRFQVLSVALILRIQYAQNFPGTADCFAGWLSREETKAFGTKPKEDSFHVFIPSKFESCRVWATGACQEFTIC